MPDGRREALSERLHRRTDLFHATGRSPDELLEFEKLIGRSEAVRPLDPAIHVCEFAGFVDEKRRIVGCLLHPTSPGNDGIDLRGLCHYGSLACRSFYCPAWDCLDPAHVACVATLVDDWHLYGLVITDVEFVRSIFGLLEEAARMRLDPALVRTTAAGDVLQEMLGWKISGPPGTGRSVRRSRYYGKPTIDETSPGRETLVRRVLDALAFTFDLDQEPTDYREVVLTAAERFRREYRHH